MNIFSFENFVNLAVIIPGSHSTGNSVLGGCGTSEPLKFLKRKRKMGKGGERLGRRAWGRGWHDRSWVQKNKPSCFINVNPFLFCGASPKG